MNLRQSRKVHRRHAELFGWPDSPYTRRQLHRASARFRKARSLECKLSCPFCGRQRYKPSDQDKPCSFEGCPSHVHDEPHPHAKLTSGRFAWLLSDGKL